ncbi:EXOIII [Halocaridina rubra]|uniref:EXOIII n=1 Tax=Halocaridina rubra TaxID=373956 RepID=A0AAN8XLQ8_HALRR
MISHVVTVVVGGVTIRDLKKCLKSNSKYRHQISATKCNGSIKENDSDGNGLSEDVSDGFTNQDPPLPDWLLHTLPRTSSLFPLSFELTSSFLKVPWEELLYLNSTPMTWNHIIKATKIPSKTKGRLRYEQACRTVVDLTFHDEGVENKTNTERGNSHLADRYDRRQLLLNPSDFYTLKYPAPFNPWYQESGFVFSKDRYEEAKPSSPMFAVDCEMCMTTANQLELTSISVINENLKLIYHKLVKPENEITNYLTQFSGITKSSLENVTTTIHSVHQDLRELLPSDAILVGHSLNCDLKAMKMMHPYIIDTAAVYNVNYIKNKPSSLRTLAKLFLNKDIQMNPHGHDPTEDAVTALELVQLKLSKDIAFGNVLKGSHLHNSEVTNVTHENGQVASLNGKLDFNSLPENLNLFQHAARNRVNTAILVTPNFARVCKEMLDGLPRERVDVHLVTGNKKLSEKAAEISMSKNFTYIQMKVRNLKSCTSRKRKCILTKLDKRLRRIYKGACQKALVMYIFTGSAKNMKSRRHHNGMVMCCIKELEEIS